MDHENKFIRKVLGWLDRLLVKMSKEDNSKDDDLNYF